MIKEVLNKKEVEEIKSLVDQKEVIEREVALLWDGSNIMVKFPKEISKFLGLNEKNRMNKSLLLRIKENPDGGIDKSFEIIQRIKKRKIRNGTHKK